VTIDRTVLEEGYALARGILGPISAPLDVFSSFRALLERMHASELRLEEARWKLAGLDAGGLATPDDFKGYDTVRANLYGGTRRLVEPLRAWLSQVHPDAARQIPTPQIAPPVAPGTGAQLLAARASASGVSGLGALPAVAVAAGAGSWMVCGIALAIVVTLALVVIGVTVTAVMVRDSIIEGAQTERYLATLTNRKAVYDDCRSSGGTAESCAQTAAQLVPPPPIQPTEGAGWSWIAWAAGALAVTAVVGGAVYVYANERGGRWGRERRRSSFDGLGGFGFSLFGPPAPRLERITARPSKRLRRNYDLDVE
jgi:hypothetical protein